MQRVSTLLQKLAELVKTEDKMSLIEADLMLDYTRVLYADLLELRNRLQFTGSLLGTEEPETEHISDVTEPDDMPTTSAPSVELTNQVNSYNLSDEQAVQTDHDIRKLIGLNDKYQYISELFLNDKEAYEEVMSKLNSFASYGQAVEWLDEHAHTPYGWNDENLAVQSFYDTLSQFFVSR
jgi:hypothetical protein